MKIRASRFTIAKKFTRDIRPRIQLSIPTREQAGLDFKNSAEQYGRISTHLRISFS
jgi:hypothetical protein